MRNGPGTQNSRNRMPLAPGAAPRASTWKTSGPPPSSGRGYEHRPPSPQREFERREPVPYRSNNEVFQFGGRGSRDDYREEYRNDYRDRDDYQGHSQRRRDDYRQDYSARERSPAHYDSHRSQFTGARNEASRGNFDFSYDAPASIRDNMREFDSGRAPQFERRQHDGPRRDRGGRGRGRGGFARGGRGDYVPKKAADRPFLQGQREPTPELMHGMDEDVGGGSKFLALGDISDSEEEDMDMSDSDNGDDAEQPRKKVARTTSKAADGDSVPRWSNPDPYTALPPPDESLTKKKDVVKLIRKARVAGTDAPKPAAETDDFISFNFDENNNNDEQEAQDTQAGSSDGEVVDAGKGVAGAPSGPRIQSYSHKDTLYESLPAKPAPQVPTKVDIIERNVNSGLGSRKRTFDDEIKGPPPFIKKNVTTKPASGVIVRDWRTKEGIDSTPWCINDHGETENMGAWLHKEIVDFHNHVKPQDFEDIIRADVLQNLSSAVRVWNQDADVRPFGSYVAGLYLPTADMDLVLVSDGYIAGGREKYYGRNALYRFRDFIERRKLCVPGSIEVIVGAKVPLVKYVDRKTGLKMDISFENETGLIANHTFKAWKQKYPAMPILVTLLKQFLTMRGLNEPVNGGIGGFSVICLVVSLLSLMPQVQSGNMIAEHHLGEILMEFFDLYGNEFNTVTTAIRMTPPGYLTKKALRRTGQVYRLNDSERKFAIIDPNNESNDISGGSKNTGTIVDCFSKAFNQLKARMAELHALPIEQRRGQSILGVILAGDYSSFDLQRDHLKYLHTNK